jgi:CAS/CSE protein, C-terminus
LSANVVPLLGIFQKLVSTSATETSAYSLLRRVLASFPPESFQPLVRDLFQVILTTIQVTPGSKPRKKDHAVAFFSFFVGKFGVAAFLDTLGTIHNGLGMTIITRVWAPTLTETKPKASLMAKEHVVGVTRLLTETPALLATPDAWLELFTSVTSIVASPVYSKLTAETTEVPEVPMVFDNTFSQLSCAKASETDYFADIAEAGPLFCQTLQGFLNQHRENLIPLIQKDENAGAIADTFQLAGFPLV